MLRKIDRGWMHGTAWEYQLKLFGKQIVPHGYYANLKEVVYITIWYFFRPGLWR